MNSIFALPIVAAVPTTAPAMLTETDPIFEALDAWRRAEVELDDLAAVYPQRGTASEMEELFDRHSTAMRAIMRTRPTTPAGLAALTSWVREEADDLRANKSHWHSKDLCAIAATLDDAVRGMSRLEPWSPPQNEEREIQEAGRAFDTAKDRDLWAEKELVRLEKQHDDSFKEELQRRGIPVRLDDCTTADAMRAWMETRDQVIPGYLEASCMEMPDEVFYDVGSAPARTVAGFLIKARAAAYACRNYWDEPCEDLDWDKKNTRMLIESLFEATGAGTVEQYLGIEPA